jgi:uncharacterized protein (DUF433 family)
MAIKQQQGTERIVKDPEILLGKPTVRGTRIPVELVLEHLAFNLDLNDLFAAYPRLSLEDVKACLAYASRSVRRGSRKKVAANLRSARSSSP